MRRVPTSFTVMLLAMTVMASACSGLPLGLGSDNDLDALSRAVLECRRLDPQDAAAMVVWLRTDIDRGAVDAVAATLDEAAGVERYEYIDAEATYKDFQEYFADEPEILDLVEPGQLPTSFQVDFVRADMAEATKADLAVFATVDDVEIATPDDACQAEEAALRDACDSAPPQAVDRMVVWLEPGINPALATEVGATLLAMPEVTVADYIDLDRTAVQFYGFYADESEMVSLIQPEQLPTSFELTLTGTTEADLENLIAGIEDLDGVTDATSGPADGGLLCQAGIGATRP